MSKFITALMCEMTGRREPDHFRNVSALLTEVIATDTVELRNEYRVEVAYKATHVCLPREREAMLLTIQRQLSEAIYGEVRTALLRLEEAYYDQDRDAISASFRDLHSIVGH